MRTHRKPFVQSIRRTILVAALAAVTTWSASAQVLVDATAGDLLATSAPTTGAAWVDVDGDGDLDLFLSNGNITSHDNQLFLNHGDGTFEEEHGVPIVSDGSPSIGSCWGDMDGDGDADAYVVNREGADNLLYRNRGDGSFERITGQAAVTDGANSNSCAWVDVDNDGDLDLFVLNFNDANLLFLNDGVGGLTPDDGSLIASTSGLSIIASWADIDADGDLDVFFGLGGDQPNQLYRNLGDGSFEAIVDDPVAQGLGSSIGASWGDVDNDGDLDLFVANFLDQDNRLYLNRGDGSFEEVAGVPVVTDGGRSVGSAFVDLDLDGDLDLVVGNDGEAVFWYRNDGRGGFSRVADGALAAHVGNTFGVAAADADGDGDPDLFLADRLGDNALFENQAPAASRLRVVLEPVVSNPSAIGAQVTALAAIHGSTVRQTRQVLPQTGYNSQAGFAVDLGLGDADRVVRLEVRWPSGMVDVLRDVPVDGSVTVREGASPEPPQVRRPREID